MALVPPGPLLETDDDGGEAFRSPNAVGPHENISVVNEATAGVRPG
jgi:hypothetical protein